MKNILFISILVCLFFQCGKTQLLDTYDINTSPNGVIPMPSGLPSSYNSFVKYTKIQCPNGQAVHFLAQNAITETQIVRARNILQFYLKDVPNSQYGTNKTAILNQMGSNDATLLLLNGSDGQGNEPNVDGQPLFQNEMAVEGHAWYINNDFDHRDAAFEEILHSMHDNGIGVDGPNSNPGALPAYQAAIRAAQQNANANNFAIWPIGANSGDIQNWYNELSQENSLSQEYLASVVDSYYGLWAPWTEMTGFGMWGIYISQTRAEIQIEDPMGMAVMQQYFSPMININMDIDPTFNGVFSMTLDVSTPYTHKSQYLQHCTLTGVNASGLKGNLEYNRLTGNDANNTLEGVEGNDKLDGKAGTDTAIFTGATSEYTIASVTGNIVVTDNIANRDGVDTLMNMEMAQFTNETIDLSTVSVNPEILIGMDGVTIFPNPTGDNLDLVLNSGNFTVRILDVNGNVYETSSINGSHSIDVSELPTGLYFLEIVDTNNNQMCIRRILKQ